MNNLISAIRYALANSRLTAEEISARMADNGTPLPPAQDLAHLLLGTPARPAVASYDPDTRRYQILPQFQHGSETAIIVGRLLITTIGNLRFPMALRAALYAELLSTVEHVVFLVVDRPYSSFGHVNFTLSLPLQTIEEASAFETFRSVYQIIRFNLVNDLAADPELARQFMALLQDARDQSTT